MKKKKLNVQLPQKFMRCVSIYLQTISAKKRYSTDTWITWKTWTQTLVFYLRARNQVYLLMCWHWQSLQGACCLSLIILWSPCVIQWLEGWMGGEQAFALPLKLKILDSSHSDFSSSHIQVLKFICSCFTGLIEEYSFMCYNLQNQHILIGI